jgi:hypothetical protein
MESISNTQQQELFKLAFQHVGCFEPTLFSTLLAIIHNLQKTKVTDSYHKILGLTRIGHYYGKIVKLARFVICTREPDPEIITWDLKIL